MIPQQPPPTARRYWLLGLATLAVLGIFLGSWRRVAAVFATPGALYFSRVGRLDSSQSPSSNGANSQSKSPIFGLPIRPRIRHSSLASGTETGQFGPVMLVDVGDDTPNFAQFVAQQASIAFENNQVCLLVTMIPKCPSCASLGYALVHSSLGKALGKVRIVRLDLDEFEEELRNLHLPIDRVPGFIRLDREGKVVDFLDAGEWSSNDPAEFAPIIEAFVHGRMKQRRHPWVRKPDSSAVDL